MQQYEQAMAVALQSGQQKCCRSCLRGSGINALSNSERDPFLPNYFNFEVIFLILPDRQQAALALGLLAQVHLLRPAPPPQLFNDGRVKPGEGEVIDRRSHDNGLLPLREGHPEEDGVDGELLDAVEVLHVGLLLEDVEALVLEQQAGHLVGVLVAVGEADHRRPSQRQNHDLRAVERPVEVRHDPHSRRVHVHQQVVELRQLLPQQRPQRVEVAGRGVPAEVDLLHLPPRVGQLVEGGDGAGEDARREGGSRGEGAVADAWDVGLDLLQLSKQQVAVRVAGGCGGGVGRGGLLALAVLGGGGFRLFGLYLLEEGLQHGGELQRELSHGKGQYMME